jgi:protein O-mannosyl-transferase
VKWAGVLALVLLAVVPFAASLNGDFIEDDRPIIRDRVDLRDLAHVPALFRETYWPRETPGGLYRPLTLASYALDRALWGAEPTGAPSRFGVHADNLLLDAVAALLVLAVLRGLGAGALAAWCGAALFAVHPVHVEAVSHMVGRADLLMTAFFLAAFALHPRGAAGRFAAAVLYLLACLSKEMAVVLPGVLLAHAWLWRGSGERAAAFAVRQARELAPCAAALAAFLTLRGVALGAAATPPVAFAWSTPLQYLAFQDPAPGEVALTMTHAFGEILGLLVAPSRLSADTSGFPHATAVSAAVAISALAIAAAAAAAIFAARRGARAPAFWALWLALTWLPVSNLLFPSGVVLAERTLYLPSVAVAGVAAWALELALARDRRWLAVPLVATAAFAARTAVRAPLWRDARTFYEETVAHGRFSGPIAKTGLVAELLRELDRQPDPRTLERALALARASLEERPTGTNLRQVAALEERAGQLDSALERRAALYHYAPSDIENLDALLHLLDARSAQADAAHDTDGALRFVGIGFTIAAQSRSPELAAAWRTRLDRAYARALDQARAAGDAEAERRRRDQLALLVPDDPLLQP